MTKFETSFEQLKLELGDFLLAIQTVRKVDAAAFQRIDREATVLAHALKGQALIPKSLLNELYKASKILRAEAPYIEDRQGDLEAMADTLETTFDLILAGESPDDRLPGVPRII
ncbi:hypothetical protein JQ604_13585 [Bradyrhizobium jicamae]|uniref:hypothetical protein n=1 Tax=Bradyrhizobium jicamae TaxID=280332 RepID=UPI001BA9A570|nr:hypothetical protein [Bradyrhizobium jicamae]MBR0753218.1 hypothetical protein [Bradyrhizobium jicamae]